MFTTSRAGCARTHQDTTESCPGSEEKVPGKWCLLGVGCGDGRMFQDEENSLGESREVTEDALLSSGAKAVLYVWDIQRLVLLPPT